MNPTTYRYWGVRANAVLATALQGGRGQFHRQHHQRNVAQYPELNPVQLVEPTAINRAQRALTLGNVQGPDSLYQAERQHWALHRQWQFGQRLSWSQTATHGPWTPPWASPVAPGLPTNHQRKDK